MIHKTHLGHHLARQAYNYADVLFNHVGYPQDIRNCHEVPLGGAPTGRGHCRRATTGRPTPSRLACGACHDGINFDSGLGVTLADARRRPDDVDRLHRQGPPGQRDRRGCTNARLPRPEHGVNKIDLAHMPVTPPNSSNSLLLGGTNANTNAAWIASGASVGRLPTGAIKVTYEVKSVSLQREHATR